ncbi:MAG: PfkB family carbohydrate kinase, partial [Acholeplasmataceae bacterium]
MPRVCLIGGANIDYLAYSKRPIRRHDSNPGYLRKSFGGVARNVAENLARLGTDTDLVTVVGRDLDGLKMVEAGEKLGVRFYPVEVSATPSYIALIDTDNDLYAGVAAMDVFSALTREEIERRMAIITRADLVFLDTNLTIEVIETLLS